MGFAQKEARWQRVSFTPKHRLCFITSKISAAHYNKVKISPIEGIYVTLREICISNNLILPMPYAFIKSWALSVVVNREAITGARKLQPLTPLVKFDGISIRHEVELENEVKSMKGGD